MSRQQFIDYIQQELDRRGWNRAELARRAHVDPSTVTRLMNGERAPTIEVVGAIAQAFGEAPEAMFRRAGLLPNMPPIQDATWRELSDIMRDMTPDDRQHVIDYAKWFRRRNRNQT